MARRIVPGTLAAWSLVFAWWAWVAWAALPALLGSAQIDIDTLGPQVGAKALDFRLTDQTGKIQTLATVAGPKGTMLVFFRSADW